MGERRHGARGPMVPSRTVRRLWAASLHAMGAVAWPLSYVFPAVAEVMARRWMRFAMDAEERRRELVRRELELQRELDGERERAAAIQRERQGR